MAGIPKATPGQRAIFAAAASLTETFVIRPIITAISAITIYTFNSLLRRYPEEAKKIAARISSEYFTASNAWVLFASTYMEKLTGHSFPDSLLKDLVGGGADKTAKAMATDLGKEYLHPMLNMIMPGTGAWQSYRDERIKEGFPAGTRQRILNPSDGVLGAERFLGVNLQFQLQSWMLHFIGDTVSFGSMKSLKDLPNAISWSYGIGWLSWLVMGTPFRVAIADPLEKFFSSIYRQTDLTPAQAIDAWNTDAITDDYFWTVMHEAGYEDDIARILKDQGSTKVPMGTLRDLYLHRMMIAKETPIDVRRDDVNPADKSAYFDQKTINELKLAGYTAGRIEHIMTDWRLDRYWKLNEKWANTAIGCYEDFTISEQSLRDALKAVGWEDVETGKIIDKQVQISNLVRASKSRLTEAQLRALYQKGLLGKLDFVERLKERGYSVADAENLKLLYYKE